MRLYQTIKNSTPWPLRRLTREVKRRITWASNSQRTPQQVFNRVYRERRWGDTHDQFYSGPGSTGAAAGRYANRVAAFIKQHGINSVVDLGCGDFRVGRMIIDDRIEYVGVDVVESLIAHNQANFATDTIRFETLDITSGPLPTGELCLIREVLQHLSNDQIVRVLRQLSQYRYVIYSDYQPAGGRGFQPNRDIVHGHDTRIWKNSCVCLDEPPFNMELELLLDLPSEEQVRAPGERIRTFLLKQPGAAPA